MLNLNGKPTQTYFSCLIDDCTRYIVHGEFFDNPEIALRASSMEIGGADSGWNRGSSKTPSARRS